MKNLLKISKNITPICNAPRILQSMRAIIPAAVLLSAVLVLPACESSGIKSEAKYPTGANRSETGGDIYKGPDSIFGEGGLGGLFSGSNKNASEAALSGASGITVNTYLWRASLDTVSFLPLVSADPFGGIIITDWYQPSQDVAERFKLNVFILDKHLKANAIKVKVFKQTRGRMGWIDTQVSNETSRQMENTILTRARELRVAYIQGTQ